MSAQFKRLYRLPDQARLAGVCAGIGEYVGLDPVVLRLIWAIVTCLTGVVPGVLAYLVAWLIVPQEPRPIPHAEPVGQAHEGPA